MPDSWFKCNRNANSGNKSLRERDGLREGGGGKRLLITSIDRNQAVCALPRCSLYVVVSILDGTVSGLSFDIAIDAFPA